jgi:hypothetical protein
VLAPTYDTRTPTPLISPSPYLYIYTSHPRHTTKQATLTYGIWVVQLERGFEGWKYASSTVTVYDLVPLWQLMQFNIVVSAGLSLAKHELPVYVDFTIPIYSSVQFSLV